MFDTDTIKIEYPLTEIYERLTGMKLKRAGRNYKGICCFHDEINASLNIFPDNKYYCYGCNAKGNNIDFVMNYLNKDFKSACEIITGNVQIREPKRLNDANKYKIQQTEISDTTKEIYQFFFENLELTKQGSDYLKLRGLNDYVLNEFKIKSIDKSKEIIEKLKSKFSIKDLRSSGLFTQNKIYPFIFSKPCIIFTVFNNNREPVYFSNRNLNSDTRFYKLSNVKQEYFTGTLDKDFIFIFESVIDAISFYQLTGSDNFIVVFGILSDSKFKNLLSKYPDKKFIIALDND